MTAGKKEIDVAWVPTAQAQIGTAQENVLIQYFMQHRQWLRDQKEESIHGRALQKIDQVYSACSKPISCDAGCAACCHARVDISKHEKRLLIAHLKELKPKVDQDRLALQAKALDEGRWDSLPFADRRCVFLDQDNRCSIYSVRPLLCRRYFVTSDKAYCHQEDWQHIERFTHPDADAYLSAVFTRFKFEALPVFLREQLPKILLALVFILGALASPAWAKIKDPRVYESAYAIAYQERIAPRIKNLPGKNEIEQLHSFLAQPGLSREEIYLAQRVLILIAYKDEKTKLCASVNIHSDDYVAQSTCYAWASDLPFSERSQKLDAIFEKALEDLPDTNVPILVAVDVLNFHTTDNDISKARTVFARVMAVAPKDAVRSIALLKWSIGGFYTEQRYSDKAIQTGVSLLEEIEPFFASQSDEGANLTAVVLTKGEGKLRLRDYPGAIREFKKVAGDPFYGDLAQVQLALAYVYNKDFTAARRIIQETTPETFKNLSSKPYYLCLRALVLYRLGDAKDILPCFKDAVGVYEILQFTEPENLDQPLPAEIEVTVWRNFYEYFQTIIVPQLEQFSDRQVDAIELERARADAKIKSLEAKNTQARMLSLGLIGLTLAALSFGWQQLRIRNRQAELLRVQKVSEHAFSELRKVVYPHQLERIRRGESLEQTMPTSSGEACVICFDIVSSSQIKHIRAKEFFRKVFSRCNSMMSEGYDGANLKARAYRIKEMGDGFLCSVGYPFESITGNPANDAMDLVNNFVRVLYEESRILDPENPITCGIGIAFDTLTGFYPEVGSKEYDIFGHALVLATRYEAMRKVLFERNHQHSVIITHEAVFNRMDAAHREDFTEIDLGTKGVVVRDDPSAKKLYCRFIAHAAKDPVASAS